MKITERLPDFPQTKAKLKGLAAEAAQLLETVKQDMPVLKVKLDGANVAAAKRSFVAAAKTLGGSVESRNAEDDHILVKWLSTPRARRLAQTVRAIRDHAPAAVEAEARRLYSIAGNRIDDFVKLSGEARRKLEISAKRNLSRKANS